jgi:hypothetical protein
MLAAVLLLVIQAPAPVAGPADTTAYLDPGARALVARARERRAGAEETITSYHATIQERISLGLRALRRDRVFYQREMVGRVAWHRDAPDTVTMLGAREAIPMVYRNAQVPEDLRSDAPDLAFRPGDERLGIGIGDSEFVYDPVAPGSEARYRVRSGDTTVITLQNGRTIRLLELRILPRRDDFHLLAGSFWFEDEHAALVRAVFRPARAWDLERDLDPQDANDAKDIPGFLKPIRGEIRYITVEFALLEGKWWLPNLIALDAVATAGNFITTPLRYEKVFTDYDVTAGEPAPVLAEGPPDDSLPEDSLPADSLLADSAAAACRGRADCRCTRRRCRSAIVIVPEDTLSLLTSSYLPRSLDDETPYLSASEMQDIGRAVGLLPATPWQAHAPTLRLGPGGAGLLRYNRVEALSVGARFGVDFGRLTLDAVGRVGTGDGWPNLELGLGHETPYVRLRLAGYRRLAAANPDTKPLGIGNSLSALFLGRDDGLYYRSWGGELFVRPVPSAAQSYQWRVFAEWQRPAEKGTDVSLAHYLSSSHRFGSNIVAQAAREFGTALVIRGAKGVSTRGATIGGELSLDAAMGTFDYGRASLTTRFTLPFTHQLLTGLELAAGTTGGDAPVQSLWYLGGPATLRGYAGGVIGGPDYWRARLELANAAPGARVALFSDAGWAGRGTALGSGRPLVSAGVGGSFFDGILRLDIARALVSPKGWRVDLYVDGIL